MQIRLLKNAGAIVMGKTNMAEWAFAPDVSIGSAFGVVRNPFDLDRSTGGSSGGTAAGALLASPPGAAIFHELVLMIRVPLRGRCRDTPENKGF